MCQMIPWNSERPTWIVSVLRLRFLWQCLTFYQTFFWLQDKDKGTRLAYVTPTPTVPRRLASTSDIDEKENRWSGFVQTCTGMSGSCCTAVCYRPHCTVWCVCLSWFWFGWRVEFCIMVNNIYNILQSRCGLCFSICLWKPGVLL